MSILTLNTTTNTKLRDSLAKDIYIREYERIVEMEMQFIPYQLAEYSYELADAFMAARKDSGNAPALSESELDKPISSPTIIGADFSGQEDQRWIEYKASPDLFRIDEEGNPILTLDGFPSYKRGPKTTH